LARLVTVVLCRRQRSLPAKPLKCAETPQTYEEEPTHLHGLSQAYLHARESLVDGIPFAIVPQARCEPGFTLGSKLCSSMQLVEKKKTPPALPGSLAKNVSPTVSVFFDYVAELHRLH